MCFARSPRLNLAIRVQFGVTPDHEMVDSGLAAGARALIHLRSFMWAATSIANGSTFTETAPDLV